MSCPLQCCDAMDIKADQDGAQRPSYRMAAELAAGLGIVASVAFLLSEWALQVYAISDAAAMITRLASIICAGGGAAAISGLVIRRRGRSA